MSLTNNTKPKIIVICGPTATGKTSTAIELAGTVGGEIVGADSMQVYRYMDIGTAKPTIDEQACVPHHMIDIVDPDEHFDARKYAEMAHEIIMELSARDITPLVVGGTGLYIKVLVHGLFEADSTDHNIRRRLKEQAEAVGTDFLYKRLNRCDPDTALRIHPHDTYRIIRALEVYELTGKTISDYHRTHRFQDRPFRVLKIGLDLDRDLLYDRINLRVDAMIEAGLIDEVKKLLGKGYSPDLKSMQSIGYRHMVDLIRNRLSVDEALRTLRRDTRRYAKRQLTWFNADHEIVWFNPVQLDDISLIIKNFLQLT
jgi:tRNA dimethylallyltransferase